MYNYGTYGSYDASVVGMSAIMSFLTTYLIVVLAVYVLLIIAMWRIFEKAGEPGWKSLIPIYNAYIYMKIAGLKNAFWVLLIVGFVVGFITGIAPAAGTALTAIEGIISLIIGIMVCNNMSKAFGHGAGFACGLFFLAPIFTLILGFNSDTYQGVPGNQQ